MTDTTKSIEQLEKDFWSDIDFPSVLVEKCHSYRKIPVQELTTEQTRTLIGQNIGIKYLVPKAYEILSKNILAEGDLYEGDLLSAVLSIDEVFWDSNPKWKISFKNLVNLKQAEIVEKSESNIHRQLLKLIDKFII